MRIRTLTAVPLLVLFLTGLAGSASAAIISDTFTVDGTTRTVGGDLNGTATEVYGATWIAETSIDFVAGDYIQRTIGGVGNNVAVVPCAPAAGATLVTLSASVKPGDTGNQANFMGLGFTPTTNKVPFWSGGGAELWIFLSPAGQYDVFADDTAHNLTGQQAAPGFVTGGWNTLELRWDRTTNQVTALVNSTVVLNAYDLDVWGFTPNIQGAGFFLYGNQSAADNFSITGVVPEPATLALLALGALALNRRPARREQVRTTSQD